MTSEGRRTLGRHKHRRVHYTTVNVKKICWDGVEWIYVAGSRDTWQAVVDAILNIRVPQKKNAENFLTR